MVLGIGILFIVTIPPARAVTLHEITTFFECTNITSVSLHERYSYD
jgi:hypothetical protein